MFRWHSRRTDREGKLRFLSHDFVLLDFFHSHHHNRNYDIPSLIQTLTYLILDICLFASLFPNQKIQQSSRCLLHFFFSQISARRPFSLGLLYFFLPHALSSHVLPVYHQPCLSLICRSILSILFSAAYRQVVIVTPSIA